MEPSKITLCPAKSVKHAKLTRAERQQRRIELDAILDAAMLKEARVPRSPRRERITARAGQRTTSGC